MRGRIKALGLAIIARILSKLRRASSVGTMINVFFDADKGEWQIATRSRINGNGKFYKTEEHLQLKRKLHQLKKY